MTAYYNENDAGAAAWLRELIREGLIADGDVDERSIADVRPVDLAGYTQCHFFAGIGGWSAALRLAAVPDHFPVWTGSCPCQPFSLAGSKRGFADDRHLWPFWRYLIAICRPAVVLGEQVAAAADWLRLVRGDLEAMDYAVGAMPVEAASAGAYHLRDRYWFVAHREGGEQRGVGERRPCTRSGELPPGRYDLRSGFVAHSSSARRSQRAGHGGVQPEALGASARQDAGHAGAVGNSEGRATGSGNDLCAGQSDAGFDGDMAHRDGERLAGRTEQHQRAQQPGLEAPCGDDAVRRDLDWVLGADGKARPVEPGVRLLVDGLPGRVGLLRGFGNAIDPRAAAAFIRATTF